MRIFLPAPISQVDVTNTIGLLRAAKLLVESGGVVLDGAELTAGVIVMQRDTDVREALEVLARAGIVAGTS
jgi:hypothetical protein